jgi:hypothetical protein
MNDPIDSHVQSMCEVEAPLHSTPCGNIENSDFNQNHESDGGYTNEASESVAASRYCLHLYDSEVAYSSTLGLTNDMRT